MIYRYKAFFTLTEDNKFCFVKIPALNYEFVLEQYNMSRFGLIKSAAKEAGVFVYCNETDGRIMPEDNPDYNEDCSFSVVLDIDTEQIALNTKIVKSFDFSDEHSL